MTSRSRSRLAAMLTTAALTLSGLVALGGPAAAEPLTPTVDDPLRLDLGPGELADGYTQVTAETLYSEDLGYGFTAESTVTEADRDTGDAVRGDFVTVAEGGQLLLDLPPADYTVALVAGDAEGTTEVALEAEQIQKVQTTSRATGEYLEMSFEIALIDGQLTLTFSGATPNLNALVISPMPEQGAAEEPTAYLTGDSTMQTYDEYWVPQEGWGQEIQQFFADGVSFDNRSIGGRSSKTFTTEGRFDEVLRLVRPGDYLFAQFGHNDATISRPERYATPEEYKEYLRAVVLGARQRDAIPVLVTPVSRLDYDPDTGAFNVSFPDYVAKVHELAAELDVPVVDLSASSRAYLDEIGPEAARSVFLHVPPGVYPNRAEGTADDTHFQAYGAIQMARLVALDVADLGLGISELVEVTVPDEVPAAPSDLIATTVTNAGATLDWSAAEGADIYRIYKRAAGEEEFSLAGTSAIPHAVISGLIEGEAYELRVTAANARGESEPGEPITITTRTADYRFDVGTPTSPVAEGYTQVTRETVYTSELGYGFIDPSNLADRDRGDGADDVARDFVIYFGGSYEFVADVPNGTYSVRAIVGDLLGTVRSSFAIEGVDRGGASVSRGSTTKTMDDVVVTDGQLNVVVSGQTAHLNGLEITSILTGPSGLTLDDLSIEGATGSVDLSWTGTADAASYRVYRDGGSGPELIGETDGLTLTDADARVGATYTYTVTAVTAADVESVPSVGLVVEIVDPEVAPPAAPSGLTVPDVGKTSVDLSWDAVDGALFYGVYRAESTEGEETLLGFADSPAFTDTDLLTTVPFYYRVTAFNAGGEGARSEQVASPAPTVLERDAEYLDRAPVAVSTADGTYIGWRMLGLDPESITFNVFRDGVKVNEEPLSGSTNLLDPDGTSESRYRVQAITGDSAHWATDEFGVWDQSYLDVPLNKPADAYTKDGQPYSYRAGDASVGDVDGDGQLEIVLLWTPTNAKDNSHAGYTGNVFVDAYEMDGTQLWRIDLGHNIRAGAHYTQLMVFDLDSDGRAEVVAKTADGTVDGEGTVIGDDGADWRNSSGYVLSGPEFLTIFDGRTGAAIDTIDYVPPRGDVESWGDGYGNRVDRFLAAVAYLDGEHPSVIFSRGYYTRAVIAAFDFDGEHLTERWVFDSSEPGSGDYAGQGNHNLSVADVDGDQKDEIVFGSATIDDDGEGLYSTGLGHGDAMHLSDLVPDNPGMEVFAAHECMSCSGNLGATMREAATGEVLWSIPATTDTGRAAAADIDPRYAGAEGWAIGSNVWNDPEGHLMSAAGEQIATSIPAANFVVQWDGDLLYEIADHVFDEETRTGAPVVYDWDYENAQQVAILEPEGVKTNNDTKGNPSLQADLFGDWREELMYRTEDSTALRIFTTTDVTEHRLRTLLSDPVYRLGIAWQNVAYNQPPHTSYFLGEGMQTPPAPSIAYTNAPEVSVDKTRPLVDLVSPSTAGPFQELEIRLDATDEVGLAKIVANVYADGKLVKSTQTRVGGDLAATHTATVSLPDGQYTIKYNAHDLNGNVSRTYTHAVTLDSTAPTVTVKTGPGFTIGDAESGYEKVSFKLFDGQKVTGFELNGVARDLVDNAWSDINFVAPGQFGAVAGQNTLVVYDVAGNATTVTFTLLE